jgi:hypothetical protein
MAILQSTQRIVQNIYSRQLSTGLSPGTIMVIIFSEKRPGTPSCAMRPSISMYSNPFQDWSKKINGQKTKGLYLDAVEYYGRPLDR